MSIDIWEKSVARDGYTPLIPAVDVTHPEFLDHFKD
jgi:hypothetical protein